jgi:hypothetical protein
MQSRDGVRRRELVARYGISRESIRRGLAEMVRMGLLARVGRARAVRYVVGEAAAVTDWEPRGVTTGSQKGSLSGSRSPKTRAVLGSNQPRNRLHPQDGCGRGVTTGSQSPECRAAPVRDRRPSIPDLRAKPPRKALTRGRDS